MEIFSDVVKSCNGAIKNYGRASVKLRGTIVAKRRTFKARQRTVMVWGSKFNAWRRAIKKVGRY